MSSKPGESSQMETPKGSDARLEERLRRIASTFPYPATPDLAAIERLRLVNRRLGVKPRQPSRAALGLAVLLIILMSALLVSPVRARVLEWIRIGSVRIFFTQPTPTAPLPALSGSPFPAVTPTYLQSVLDLAGETSFSEAQEQVDFTIQVPTYPADLGQPDLVYLQQLNGPAVILVWIDPGQAGQVIMSLSESSSEQVMFEKYDPESVLDTQVSGQPAVWIEGDYVLVMRNGDFTMTRLIDQGHTLIWGNEEMTFRLETDVDLETAIRIAESMR